MSVKRTLIPVFGARRHAPLRQGAMLGRNRPWGFPTLPARALPPLPTRGAHAITWQYSHADYARVPWCGPVAVGRDVPIAPPRHRRGARLGIPQNSHARLSHTTTGHAHYPGRRDGRPPGLPARALPPLRSRGMRTPLPTRNSRGHIRSRGVHAITHAHYTRAIRTPYAPNLDNRPARA